MIDWDLIDTFWVLFSAVLVALMQPGFTALEAGQTRAKNSISTAIKNVSDFLIAFIVFITVGASSLEYLLNSNLTNSLLFIDLDGFKQANDQFGHDAGDEILKVVAQRIEALIRKDDTACRFGGDEFVVLMNDVKNDTQAASITERLMESIRQPIEFAGNTLRVDSSVGMKLFDGQTQMGVEALIKEADQAMYVAKNRGKGTWVLA